MVKSHLGMTTTTNTGLNKGKTIHWQQQQSTRYEMCFQNAAEGCSGAIIRCAPDQLRLKSFLCTRLCAVESLEGVINHVTNVA
jgi:hypothetical protein